MDEIDVAIIGGGVNGLAVAYMLGQHSPGKSIFVFEKNKYLGEEQSGRNSGVRHSGYQYQVGTLKSRLCHSANKMLRRFAQEHGIADACTGKYIVATTPEEVDRLDFYHRRAFENGTNIELLDRIALQEREPNLEALAALYTSDTGVIDVASYVRTLRNLIVQQEGNILTESKILGITPKRDNFVVRVQQHQEQSEFECGMVINAAGLYADEVARMVNPEFPYTITPLRGEYMTFTANRPQLQLHDTNVYPVPRPIPRMYDSFGHPKTMAGVHITPTFAASAEGSIQLGKKYLVGPLGRIVGSKDDYHTDRKGPKAFYDEIKPFFPGIQVDDLTEDFAGIQVKLNGHDDFVLERDRMYPHLIHVIADSPGMTSSLAIAEYVVTHVVKQIF